MLSLTFLYNLYIDRPKLSEKNPFEYIVSPPTRGSERKSNKKAKIKNSIEICEKTALEMSKSLAIHKNVLFVQFLSYLEPSLKLHSDKETQKRFSKPGYFSGITKNLSHSKCQNHRTFD